MANIRYVASSAEMEMFLNDQQKEMRNAMANIRKATKASMPLHDFWTAKQIFEKPLAIAAHEYNTVNDEIVWDQNTRVPMLPDFTTTSIAYHSDVPMHMVKHSDARMAATLIAQEGYDRALEGSVNHLGEIDEASGSSTITSYNPMPTEPMSKQTEEAEAVEHQDSTQESPQNQTSPQAEPPVMVSSDTEHPEGQPIAGGDDDETKETASQGPAPTQAAASTQPANATTSKCMLPNCQRPMTRAEVRRTHLVTHYAKWHGMPAVQRVYGGNWSASNDAQDAIIVPWLRSLGVDPASIKLNGEVVFKG
ncbi:hypothetical protein KC340_g2587 [Hortaea werneckii]|nr:hypothetical protein KC342_g2549 [Hortaea werneckii]KAI7104425.1 hypothetical protein KC339_g4544 [Hortaea werneckii]KAI7245191.1 hypothetical protein KC365_g685 [Hortaea werneckii]KAI7334182.1 hypothetical protein KC340_g2587 [Hortaea werneckii]KAI7403871.1 hypothetical protein KC328_g2150 [Hortaea werneckii]